MMRLILVIIWIFLLGGVWKLLHAPSDLSSSIPYLLQLSAVLGWLALFTWGIISHPVNKSRATSDKSRAIWLICGFILYSLLRLVLFATTDYDHQRRIFLILTALVVSGMMILWQQRSNHAHQKQQNKENFTV